MRKLLLVSVLAFVLPVMASADQVIPGDFAMHLPNLKTAANNLADDAASDHPSLSKVMDDVQVLNGVFAELDADMLGNPDFTHANAEPLKEMCLDEMRLGGLLMQVSAHPSQSLYAQISGVGQDLSFYVDQIEQG